MSDLQEMLKDMPHPRSSELVEYLKQSGRYSQCPFCPHDGGWELHLMLPNEGPEEDDPRLMIFNVEALDPELGKSQCAGLTCPNCGHFSLVSLYKLAEFQKSRMV